MHRMTLFCEYSSAISGGGEGGCLLFVIKANSFLSPRLGVFGLRIRDGLSCVDATLECGRVPAVESTAITVVGLY